MLLGANIEVLLAHKKIAIASSVIRAKSVPREWSGVMDVGRVLAKLFAFDVFQVRDCLETRNSCILSVEVGPLNLGIWLYFVVGRCKVPLSAGIIYSM